MIEAWGELTVREAFGEAARAFAELVRSIPPESWDGPGSASGASATWSGTRAAP